MNYRAENERRRAAEEARQLTCDHVWVHAFQDSPKCSSSWCGKCMISAFAYERDKQLSA
jgi:hypothetical protein